MTKKITITIVVALLCLNFGAFAQQSDKSGMLRVGDRIPPAFWEQEHSVYYAGKITRETLAAHKDQLIILDFWATWCGTCLNKFPFLEAMQAKYKDKIKVILVNCIGTQDTHERIVDRLNGKLEPFVGSSLPTIEQDTLLLRAFPHSAIPHYVWLMDGGIRGITASEFLNESEIISLIEKSASRKVDAEILRKQIEEVRKNKKTKPKTNN